MAFCLLFWPMPLLKYSILLYPILLYRYYILVYVKSTALLSLVPASQAEIFHCYLNGETCSILLDICQQLASNPVVVQL